MRASAPPALALLGLLTSVMTLLGCATKPAGRLTVDDVSILGTKELNAGDVASKLATQSTSSIFGMVLQYEVYDKFVVERDLQRVERYYKARGYYDARVRAGRVTRVGEDRVSVEIEVEEGPPTKLTLVRVERLGKLSSRAGYAVGKAQTMQPGHVFDEDTYEEMKKGILRALTDNSHAYAKLVGGFTEQDLIPDGGNAIPLDPLEGPRLVAEQAAREQAERDSEAAEQQGKEGAADAVVKGEKRFAVRVDAVNNTAEIYLQADPGPECRFGDIKIEGLGSLPESQVRAALGIRRGRRFSTADLESARHALLELGVFSSAEYSVDLSDPRNTAVPVTFNVTPAPLHTVTLGGGFRTDVLQSDAHLLAGYEHLNFMGGLRRLTMQVQPGVVLFPTNLQNLLGPEKVLPQARGRAELRQPQFIEHRTRGTLRGDVLIYPYITPIRNRSEVPDVVVGYREFRPSAGVDRTFFKGRLALAAFYNLQVSYPFAYFGTLDQGISRVLISHISLSQTVDLRDNAVKPRLGMYFANEVQLAGGFLGGDAADVKVQPDVRAYVPLSRRVTLATRGSVGFLFPRSYGDTLGIDEAPDAATDPLGAREFETARNRDLQLLFFRALFSGGPNSNRGYPLRGVGPRGIAPFQIGGANSLRNCVGRASGGGGVPGASAQIAKIPDVDPEACGVPFGGLSLWEASVEVRIQLSENLSTLLFVDASDVTRKELTLRFDYPHLSVGSGLRYDTPVGPVRLDVGYAIPGLQRIGGELDPLTEGRPATLLGLPVALNIAVGEAF